MADFGISVDDPGATVLTDTATVGTEIYKAPEWKPLEPDKQMRPGRLADIFSLRAVFLEMLLVHSGQNLDMIFDEQNNHL